MGDECNPLKLGGNAMMALVQKAMMRVDRKAITSKFKHIYIPLIVLDHAALDPRPPGSINDGIFVELPRPSVVLGRVR
jgi:hypothetical protein